MQFKKLVFTLQNMYFCKTSCKDHEKSHPAPLSHTIIRTDCPSCRRTKKRQEKSRNPRHSPGRTGRDAGKEPVTCHSKARRRSPKASHKLQRTPLWDRRVTLPGPDRLADREDRQKRRLRLSESNGRRVAGGQHLSLQPGRGT